MLPRKKTSKPQNNSRAGSSGSALLSAELKNKVFERDNYTCQCCAFRSEKYQQVHHKDNDLHNTDLANLLTTCIFCHQCFNMAKAADMEAATLIWLPEIEQSTLNNIARGVYVAQISQGPIADAAREILDVLKGRRQEAEKRLGTDNPYILASVLDDYMSAKQYHGRTKKLDGIRLFPLNRRNVKEAELEFNQFPQILAYWRSKNGPFGVAPPQKWVSVYQDMLKAVA